MKKLFLLSLFSIFFLFLLFFSNSYALNDSEENIQSFELNISSTKQNLDVPVGINALINFSMFQSFIQFPKSFCYSQSLPNSYFYEQSIQQINDTKVFYIEDTSLSSRTSIDWSVSNSTIVSGIVEARFLMYSVNTPPNTIHIYAFNNITKLNTQTIFDIYISKELAPPPTNDFIEVTCYYRRGMYLQTTFQDFEGIFDEFYLNVSFDANIKQCQIFICDYNNFSNHLHFNNLNFSQPFYYGSTIQITNLGLSIGTTNFVYGIAYLLGIDCSVNPSYVSQQILYDASIILNGYVGFNAISLSLKPTSSNVIERKDIRITRVSFYYTISGENDYNWIYLRSNESILLYANENYTSIMNSSNLFLIIDCYSINLLQYNRIIFTFRVSINYFYNSGEVNIVNASVYAIPYLIFLFGVPLSISIKVNRNKNVFWMLLFAMDIVVVFMNRLFLTMGGILSLASFLIIIFITYRRKE